MTVSALVVLTIAGGAFMWWQEPVRQLERQAHSGQISAMIELADIYLNAEPPRPESAEHWLEQAARSGHLQTARRLTTIYRNPQHPFGDNPGKLREWTLFLARRGDRVAQFDIAEMDMIDGVFTQEGLDWLRQSEGLDYPPSCAGFSRTRDCNKRNDTSRFTPSATGIGLE